MFVFVFGFSFFSRSVQSEVAIVDKGPAVVSSRTILAVYTSSTTTTTPAAPPTLLPLNHQANYESQNDFCFFCWFWELRNKVGVANIRRRPDCSESTAHLILKLPRFLCLSLLCLLCSFFPFFFKVGVYYQYHHSTTFVAPPTLLPLNHQTNYGSQTVFFLVFFCFCFFWNSQRWAWPIRRRPGCSDSTVP